MGHKSRLAYVVIDCQDLDVAAAFWGAALEGTVARPSAHGEIYRLITLAGEPLQLLLQLVLEEKTSKSRMHLDIESTDVEAEVRRLCRLGATRLSHVIERGVAFWVLSDPFGNEFCVIEPNFPELLAARPERPS